MADNIFCFNESPSTLVGTTLPGGYYLGMLRQEGGKQYRLVQATGTISQFQIVKYDTSKTTPNQQVTATAAATDSVAGLCEVASVVNTSIFWMTVYGPGTASLTGTVAANAQLSASGTAGVGQAAPFTAATAQTVWGIAMVSNAGGPNNKAVFVATS